MAPGSPRRYHQQITSSITSARQEPVILFPDDLPDSELLPSPTYLSQQSVVHPPHTIFTINSSSSSKVEPSSFPTSSSIPDDVKLKPPVDDWRLYTHLLVGDISLYAWLDSGANVNVISPSLAKYLEKRCPAYDFQCNSAVFGESSPTISTSKAMDILIFHKEKPITLQFIIHQLPNQIPMLIGLPDQFSKLGISFHGLSSGPSPSSDDEDPDTGTTTADPHEHFYSQCFSKVEPGSLGDAFLSDEVRTPILEFIRPFLALNSALDPNKPCSFPDSTVFLSMDESIGYWRNQYPIPRKLRASLNAYFEDLLAKGFIEPAPLGCSFNLPHCPAPKKHPITREKIDTRWCLDPRALNVHLAPTPNNLPRIHELFLALQNSSVFSAIDLKHAYLQFNLNPSDRKKTAFTATINGTTKQFMYNRAIWGIRHLSHHVQSVMRRMFCDFDFVTIYIDDIIVHSRSAEEHASHLARVIERLTEFNLLINVEKTLIGMSRFRAFGHIASGASLCADPQKIAAVLAWPIPKSGKDIESFLGFVNWLRDFIPHYASVAAPLESIRKFKSLKEVWGPIHLKAFDSLKKLVEANVQLTRPDDTAILQVATDASNYGVGAVLFQVVNNRQHIISFHSKSLSKAQRNYSATKRELWGVVSALRAFREYLYGTYFHLHTDHKALVFLHTQRHLNPMLLTWFEELMEMDFDIFHTPGLENVLPDELSRVFKYFLNDEFSIAPIPATTFNKSFDKDRPSTSLHSIYPIDAFPASQDDDSPSLDESILMVPTQNLQAKPLQALKRLVKEFLNLELPSHELQSSLLHEEHSRGHFGARSIVQAITRKGYYWPLLSKDAERVVGNCKPCQRFNIVREGFHPLRSIATTSRFNHWSIDLATDLPLSPDGFKHILVILIRGSEFRLLVPIKDKTSLSVATALWEKMSIFGPPAIIQSDRGSEFIADTLKELVNIHGIDHRLVAQYNPRANGAVEKCVGTTKKLLVKLCNGASHNWPCYLPTIQFFFNRKINPTTGSAPFSLLFGRAITGFENFHDFVPAQVSPAEFKTFTTALFKELDSFIFPAVSERVAKQHATRAEHVDSARFIHSRPLPIGSIVNVTSDPFERKIFGAQQSHGPYIITGVSPNQLYYLASSNGTPFDRPVPVTQLKLLPHVSSDDFANDEHYDTEAAVTKVLDMKQSPDGTIFYLLKFRGTPIPEWTPADNCQCPSKIRAFRRARAAQQSDPKTPVQLASWPSEDETLILASNISLNSLVTVRDPEASPLDLRYLVGEVLSINNDNIHLHYLSVDSGDNCKLRPIKEPRFRKTFIDPTDNRPTFSRKLRKTVCVPWVGDHSIHDLITIDLILNKDHTLSEASKSRMSSFLPTTLQEINARASGSSKV